MFVLLFRTALVYGLIIFAMRLMGKRQLGELQPSELVSTILISNLASISIEAQEVPLLASLLPVFFIVCAEILLSVIGLRYPRTARVLSGSPVAVIRDGTIDQDALRQLRFSMSDLMEALRNKDVFDPSQVSYALVEANGSLSVCLKDSFQPACKQDVNVPSQGMGRPVIPFIMDGTVLPHNLDWCGKSMDWLNSLLKQENCQLSDVQLLLGNELPDYQLITKEKAEKP